MGHCGDRVAALVDGELSHEARDRMLAHLARCPECRQETEALRRTKAMVLGLDTPAPAPHLLSDLLRIAEHGIPGALSTPPPGITFGGGATMAHRHGDSHGDGGDNSPRWPGLLSAGAFTLATAVFGSIFMMAFVPTTATSAGDPHVTPPYGQTLVEPAVDVPGGHTGDPAGGLQDGSTPTRTDSGRLTTVVAQPAMSAASDPTATFRTSNQPESVFALGTPTFHPLTAAVFPTAALRPAH